MEINELYRVKHTITLQVIRDILIENEFTTRQDFKERLLNQIDKLEMDESTIHALKENIG